MIEGRLKSNKIKQRHLQTGLPILHINEYKDAYLVNTSVRLFSSNMHINRPDKLFSNLKRQKEGQIF